MTHTQHRVPSWAIPTSVRGQRHLDTLSNREASSRASQFACPAVLPRQPDISHSSQTPLVDPSPPDCCTCLGNGSPALLPHSCCNCACMHSSSPAHHYQLRSSQVQHNQPINTSWHFHTLTAQTSSVQSLFLFPNHLCTGPLVTSAVLSAVCCPLSAKRARRPQTPSRNDLHSSSRYGVHTSKALEISNICLNRVEMPGNKTPPPLRLSGCRWGTALATDPVPSDWPFLGSLSAVLRFALSSQGLLPTVSPPPDR